MQNSTYKKAKSFLEELTEINTFETNVVTHGRDMKPHGKLWIVSALKICLKNFPTSGIKLNVIYIHVIYA